MRIHRALDARLDNEKVIRGDVQRDHLVQPPLLLLVEYLVEGVVGEKESQGGAAAVCGHTGLADPLLLVVRPAEAHFLPAELVGGAILLMVTVMNMMMMMMTMMITMMVVMVAMVLVTITMLMMQTMTHSDS